MGLTQRVTTKPKVRIRTTVRIRDCLKRKVHQAEIKKLRGALSLTSVLIPWNTCGAFMAATLGVATFEYAPYALFNLICPMLAVIFGYLMIAQPRAEGVSA